MFYINILVICIGVHCDYVLPNVQIYIQTVQSEKNPQFKKKEVKIFIFQFVVLEYLALEVTRHLVFCAISKHVIIVI